MRKTLIFALTILLIFCTAGIQTFADEGSAKVFVTISDGKLEMAQAEITVTDIDGDGALTIDDALYCAHEAKYEGGAAAGYGSAKGAYGLALTKLWGVENGGSYGYYVNNTSANGLADTVKSGDYVNAFAYTDLTAYSDTYCYFDVNVKTAVEGTEFVLTLSGAGYDAEWKPITVPVAGATITIDGKETEVKTDENGKATVKLDKAGTSVISAVSATQTLVPPVCIVTASEKVPQTGDDGNGVYYVLAVSTLCALGYMLLRRRRTSIDA